MTDLSQYRDEIAAWWLEFDGPAYPTGEEVAAALLASPVVARMLADARAEAWHRGASYAIGSTEDDPALIFADNPYRAESDAGH